MVYSDNYGATDHLYEFFEVPAYPMYNIMQYTGLKDKNGIEIYEGDIIKAPVSSFFRYNIYEVQYVKNRFVPDDICDDDVEVIGNIFENKELLL